MISSIVLPWIGGPSLCSSPGRIRNFHTEYSTTTSTSTKTGTEAISEDVVEVVDLLRLRGRLDGEPVDRQRDGDADDRRDRADDQHLRQRVLYATICLRAFTGAGSYATASMNGNAMAGGRMGAVRRLRGRSTGSRVRTVAAEGRRRQALVATERLGELRRLAVADALGDLAHGQAVRREQGCGALHAHPGQMLAEGRAPISA